MNWATPVVKLGTSPWVTAFLLALWLGCAPVLAVAGGAPTTDAVGWSYHVLHVTSSAIDLLGYNATTQRMYIKFTTGGEYLYDDVPAQVYADFLDAPSKGQYFQWYIRGNYTYTRLRPPVK